MSNFSFHHPVNSGAKLKELKKLISESNLDTRPEDQFLERFLKLRRYDVKNSFNKLRHYENFKTKHEDNFLVVKRGVLRKVLESKILDILEGRDITGRRVIWVRSGCWDPSSISADEILQVAGLLSETVLALTQLDVISVNIIFDMNDFGMRHIHGLSTKFAKKMVYYLSECIPIHIHSIYVIREPKVFSIIYSCFKPFLDDQMKKIIRFYGQDLVALQEHIRPEVLPPELGGNSPEIYPDRWLKIMDSPPVQEELKKCRYKFVSG